MGTKTYDPNQIKANFGPHLLTGFAKGTFIKVTRDEDTFKKYVGADGVVTRIRSRNKSGSIEFTLSQASPSNDFLSAIALQDELLGTGIMPAAVKDMNGTTLAAGGEAWVVKPAETEYGDDATTRPWKIDVAQLTS